MTNNLIAELVRKGIPARKVAKTVAKTLGITEKTARNKLNGFTQWTVPEAVKINAELFDGKQSIEYLFSPFTPAA